MFFNDYLNSPSQARVSGVVEESSSKLEYQVAVYRYVDAKVEAQRSSSIPISAETAASRGRNNGPFLVPLDDAVPIGTRLQLRTTIQPQSGLTFMKANQI